MPIKNLTLGLCLLVAGQALAQNCTHVVKEGDSISALAAHYHTTQKSILNANGLKDRHSLRLGQKLVIPVTSSDSDRTVRGGVPLYTVQLGDFDGLIANRYDISVSRLYALNPGVNWQCLQIGQKLRVPGADAAKTNASAKGTLRTHHAVVSRDSVIVRVGPDQRYEAIAKVDEGTSVDVLDHNDDWYKLQFPHGTVGWVRGDMLQDASMPPMEQLMASNGGGAPPADPRQKVIQTAKSFRGVRYRWGGMSRSGTDCSGFTSQVFRAQGIKLPRTSTIQATVGRPVAGQLQPGDLVFFKTTRASRISHVGIYVGNGRFIHASSGGGKVQINSLREQYYRNRFATARRVMKGTPKAQQPEIAALQQAADQVASTPEASQPETTPIVMKGTDEIGK